MKTKRLFLGAAIAMMVSTGQAATTAEVVCSYAPSQSATVNRITAAAGGAGVGASAILSATGLQFVAHSGGGYILTGSGGYVAGTLLSPILIPTVIVATVVVGGATVALELTCAPRNHPQAVERVKEITASFNEEVRAANEDAMHAATARTGIPNAHQPLPHSRKRRAARRAQRHIGGVYLPGIIGGGTWYLPNHVHPIR